MKMVNIQNYSDIKIHVNGSSLNGLADFRIVMYF